MKVIVRKELEQDHKTVELLVEEAFKDAEYSDHMEHVLVSKLRKGENFIDGLSLVAEKEGEIVGHILLTKANIENETEKYETLALAPVSVLPKYQGIGIGGELIREGMRMAKELGYDSIIVLGHDKYYPKFGFKKAGDFGIKAPFEVPEENFMAIELNEEALKNISGVVRYANEFLADNNT